MSCPSVGTYRQHYHLLSYAGQSRALQMKWFYLTMMEHLSVCQTIKVSFHQIDFQNACTIEAYVSILKQAEHFSHTSLHGYTHFISLRKTFDWKLKIPGFCLIHELNKQSTVQKSIALKLWPKFWQWMSKVTITARGLFTLFRPL